MADSLAKERFVAHGKDELVAESQCAGCSNNLKVKCKVFGKFPWAYRDALSKIKCPKIEKKI